MATTTKVNEAEYAKEFFKVKKGELLSHIHNGNIVLCTGDSEKDEMSFHGVSVHKGASDSEVGYTSYFKKRYYALFYGDVTISQEF